MEAKFNRKPVNYVIWCLKSVGVILHQEGEKNYNFYKYLTVYPFLYTFLSISLYVIKNLKHVSDAVMSAAYLGGCVVMLSFLIIFTRNRRMVLKFLQLMDTNLYTYPDENDMAIKVREIFKDENAMKFILLVMAYEFFGFSLGILSPVFSFIVTGIYEAKMFPAWYPWEIRGTFSLIVTTIIQVTGCMIAFWITYVTQVFLACVTVEFIKQYQRLRVALSSIQNRSTMAVSKLSHRNSYINWSITDGNKIQFQKIYNDLYRENVVHCVKHHQELWKLFHLFQPWFSLYYSVEIGMSAVVFALAFYNLLINWSPSMFLTILGSTFNILANLFSRCIVGEIFAEMNTKLQNVIFYEMNWWEQSMENQNLLLIFHMLSKRSYDLKAFSVYDASYYTFSRLMRLSYSYFNIILSSIHH